jgi:hypothetical protein
MATERLPMRDIREIGPGTGRSPAKAGPRMVESTMQVRQWKYSQAFRWIPTCGSESPA